LVSFDFFVPFLIENFPKITILSRGFSLSLFENCESFHDAGDTVTDAVKEGDLP